MKTVVFQTYKTENVPEWLMLCMNTVKQWAEAKGYDYTFYDDCFFEFAPDWYREKARGDKLLITDLARLVAARNLIASGYDRAIWVDADIVIFDTDRFVVDVTEQFAFCLEIWSFVIRTGKLGFLEKINNSVSVFVKGNTILDFYIDACLTIVKTVQEPVHFLEVGTKFLTGLYKILPFQTLTNTMLFSPPLVDAISRNSSNYLRQFMKQQKTRIYSANMCASLATNEELYQCGLFRKVKMTDALYLEVVQILLSSRGDVLNNHFEDGGS